MSDIKTFKHEKGKVLINSKIANLKQKQVSTNYKFANETSYVNKIKHYPAAIKEWSKNQYSYNKNTNKTYPSLDNKLCILIKSYFNSYSRKLENNLRKMRQRKLKIKQKRSITNKIIPGKTELKHNNDKLIITVYVYNNQKRYYLNKLRNTYEEIYMKNFSRRIFRREIRSTYLKQLLKFNSIKFDKIYVSILANEVKKLYNKKIEFNFISIKYPFLDSSVFFRIILGKIKKNKHKYLNILNNSLSMFQVQSLKNFNAQDTYNEMYKKDLVIQNLDFNNFNSKPLSDTLKLRNQINGFDLNKDDVLDKYLSDLTYKKKDTLNVNSYNYIIRPSIKDYRYKLINVIKSVKYKYLSGIRMETSGRLSRYNTASRSKSGFSYKGNIKNVNSSYKGLSTVVLRGHSKSNLQYNKLSSKVRIGSFGLKGSIASI
uniref:Small ribosomal subunit protein uS3m n=1 Tax=Bacidia sorediata TaxID=1885590 RepID=A0A515MN41_9LECA|nr:ribosomal protein S3 [Bacidia sorediata]